MNSVLLASWSCKQAHWDVSGLLVGVVIKINAHKAFELMTLHKTNGGENTVTIFETTDLIKGTKVTPV